MVPCVHLYRPAVAALVAALIALSPAGHAQDDPHARAAALNQQVREMIDAGRLSDAEPIARDALRRSEAARGPDHPDVAATLSRLGQILRLQGRLVEAEQLQQRSLAIYDKRFGADYVAPPGIHDSTDVLDELAALKQAEREPAAAEALYRRALALREKALGPEHPNVAANLKSLAQLYMVDGRTADAEPLYARSLTILEKVLGPDHPDVAAVLDDLAGMYAAEMRDADAEPLYRRSLAILEKVRGPEHPDIAKSLVALARALKYGDRVADAEPLLRRILTIKQKALGPDHAEVGSVLEDLAWVLRSLGRNDEATPLALSAAEIGERTRQSRAVQAEGADLRARIRDGIAELESAAIQHQRAGQHGEAQVRAREALALGEAGLGHEDPRTVAALDTLIAVLFAQYQLAEAEALAKRSLASKEKSLRRDDPDLARTALTLATILRERLRFGEAESLFRRSIAIFETAWGRNHPSVATALNELAQQLQVLGWLSEAETLLERALAIREQARGVDEQFIAQSLGSLAGLRMLQGRYIDAENLYRRSLAEYEKSGIGSGSFEVSVVLNNLAEVFKRQGRLDDAEPLYRRTIAILEDTVGAKTVGVAVVRANLAALIDALGRHTEAEALLKQSLAIQEGVVGVEHPVVAGTLNELATLLVGQGRSAEAEPLLKRALAIVEKSLAPENKLFVDVLYNRARALVAQRRYADAEPIYRRALTLSEQTLAPDHPEVARVLSSMATLKERQGRNNEALALHRRSSAIRAGRFERSEQAAERGAGVLSEQRLSAKAFLDHLGVAARLAAVAKPGERRALHDEAFQLVDRAKAATAGVAVARMAARYAAGSDALSVLVRDQQDVVDQIRATDAALINAISRPVEQTDIEAIKQLRERATALRQRAAAIGERLRDAFPTYAEIASPRPPSLDDAQGLLGPGELLLAFAVGEAATQVFAVRRDRVEVGQVPVKRAELVAAVRALRAGIDPAGKTSLGELAPFEASKAHDLYRQLLGPAAPLLDGVKHLFVVPDGALDSLPVGVLLAAPPSKAQFAPDDHAAFRAADWLGKRMAVSVLPSVGSLRALRQFTREAKASQPFLGVGDPLLKDHPADRGAKRAAEPKALPVASMTWTATETPALRALFRGGAADPDVLRQVESLPDTADELAAMATVLGASAGSLVLREQATETTVKRADLARYKVLAFATHGVVAGELSGLAEPALILTPPRQASADDDGLLTASEVTQLKLDADWVILSACNTAAADGTPGADGLSGLAKAFFYAGARALFVSHWIVVSEATVTLTTTMLKEAAQPGVGRAEAHRRAMAAMIADRTRPEYAHPVFWAPFVVVGEGGAGAPRAAR